MDLHSLSDRFLRYVQIDTESDPHSMSFPSTEKQKDLAKVLLNDILRKLILNAEGKQVIEEGHMLPVDLALASLSKIGEQLGKSGTK